MGRGVGSTLAISGSIILFVSLLAYHLVHTLRTTLKAGDMDFGWETLRSQLETQ